jgi:hypothetical protein
MAKFIEMDDYVKFSSQLEEDVGPIAFVNMVIFDEVHLVSETATTLRKVFDKLRSKLAGKIGGYYHHTHNIRTSAFTFKLLLFSS